MSGPISMSLLATLALAASVGTTLPQCNWDRPGANPFMGDVVAAVDRYTDIPAATRSKLQARMKARQYDEIALIQRDGIQGQSRYESEIRDMHFGAGAVCRTVTRSQWTAKMQERGLVYCEDGQCILVPTVCRNVSRIRRAAPPAAVAPSQSINLASSTREGAAEALPLEFEAPGAGPLAAGGTPDSFANRAGLPGTAPGFASDSGGLGAPGGASPNTSLGGGGGQPGLIETGIPALPGRVAQASLPTDTPAVPEPHTALLLALGLLVVGHQVRRKR